MSKEDKILINKIVVRIGDKDILLTPDQAKELSRLLNEMFGLEKIESTKVEHHWHYDYIYRNVLPYYPNFPFETVIGGISNADSLSNIQGYNNWQAGLQNTADGNVAMLALKG